MFRYQVNLINIRDETQGIPKGSPLLGTRTDHFKNSNFVFIRNKLGS